MQETQTQYFKLTQRLTPHLVADELFYLSGRIYRRMRAFGIMHTVNLVYPTNRDLYEIAYSLYYLLQLLEDQEPKLRYDIEIQKQRARDSEDRAIKYQKEAFAMQCRIEELEAEIRTLKQRHKQNSQLKSSYISQAQFNEDIYRMKLRKEQRELERIKNLAVKNGVPASSGIYTDVGVFLYDPAVQTESGVTQVQDSLYRPQNILRQPHMTFQKSPQLNKSVSFRDQNADQEPYEPRHAMDVVKSKELQYAVYFGQKHAKTTAKQQPLSIDQLEKAKDESDFSYIAGNYQQYATEAYSNEKVAIYPYANYSATYSPPQQQMVSPVIETNYSADVPEFYRPAALDVFSNDGIVLYSSRLQRPSGLDSDSQVVPSFSVYMDAGKPTLFSSLYNSNTRPEDANYRIPTTRNQDAEDSVLQRVGNGVLDFYNPSIRDDAGNQTGYLPYAEVKGPSHRPQTGSKEGFMEAQASIQASAVPSLQTYAGGGTLGLTGQTVQYFTFPTIPVTIISASPDFSDARLRIDYQQLYNSQRADYLGIQDEYCKIAQERRMIDAARSQVITEEEKVQKQKQRIQQAVQKLEGYGINVQDLVDDLRK